MYIDFGKKRLDFVKKPILLSMLFLFIPPCHADVIHASFTNKGILVDAGDTGTFLFAEGPALHYKNATTGKDTAIKPTYQPGSDGLSGILTYPGSPGDFKIDVKFSAADGTLDFTFNKIDPSFLSLQFATHFDAGQFRGGRYAFGGKPLTDIPLEITKGESMRTGQFDLVGRDGVGFTIKNPVGYEGFSDERKYKPDSAQSYGWNFSYPFGSATAPSSFAITLKDLKVPVTKQPVVKPPGPPSDGNWVPIPELTDDFKGTKLDDTKWWDHNPGWPGRSPSYFASNNVRVSDGLQLLARLQDPPPSLKAFPGYKNYSTACLVSKTLALYGYFEIKAKASAVNLDSAFWFFTKLPSPPSNQHIEEMDVFEIGGGGGRKFERRLYNTMHVWKSPDAAPKTPWTRAVEFQAPARLADDYHVYGYEWDKDEIKCYFDGYLFAHYANTNWHYPETLLLDIEIQKGWFGVPKPEEFSGSFDVAYVHSWKRADEAPAIPPAAAADNPPAAK